MPLKPSVERRYELLFSARSMAWNTRCFLASLSR
jgi:hypothetical protein